MNDKPFFEHEGKVIERDKHFRHIMAITLDPTSGHHKGVARCIVSREGDVEVAGYVDRSELYLIEGFSLEKFALKKRLIFKNENEIIDALGRGRDFIGLEDPDIWIDESDHRTHLYFTMPFRNAEGKNAYANVYLGHAVGKNLDSLEMTMPVLGPEDGESRGAKEVSIAPLNRQGFRYNLIESSKVENDFVYSTINVAIAEDMGTLWKFGEIAFHPKTHKIPWIAGHASPGPLFPKSFIDVGAGKLLGAINGREANKRVAHEIKYGMFSVGFFIYDYENGRIDWVSKEPFIQDSEARTITFASQFVDQKNGKGILYAHVDDSFVRAYTLDASAIKALIP